MRQTQETIRTDTPNSQPRILFFLRALPQQMKRLAKKVEREKIVLSALPELSVNIFDYAREHGRVTIGDMVTLTGTSRNTLKQHFRQLLKKGHLVMPGRGRGAWYGLA
jgi:predicted HTH transcriptional regulator